MNEECYDLIFKGELQKNADLKRTKLNLMHLFKINQAKVETLFTGKPIILKRNLDAHTANKYRVALKKAGAVISLRKSEKAAPVKTKPQAPESNDSPAAHVSLAPVGSPLLNEKEKHKTPSVTVPDLNHLNLKQAHGNLLEAHEYQRPEKTAIAARDFSVAPTGSDLLRAEERQKQEAKAIKTEHLSIAEAGVRLGEKKVEAARNIDLSGISLTEQP